MGEISRDFSFNLTSGCDVDTNFNAIAPRKRVVDKNS